MYVRPISTRLFRGMLTPAIRAMADLPLPLLVTRVLADHEHAAVPADDLALLTHRLDRWTYLHGPFRLDDPDGRLWRPVRPPLPSPGNGGGTPEPRGSRARPSRIAKGFVRSRRCAAALSLALVTLTAAPPAGADPLADHAPVLVHDSDERNPLASVARAGVAAREPRVYGRVAGSWLQYWLFYAQNGQDRGVLRTGRHAGDWEMVQVRMEAGRPVEAVYSQHSGAERCGWGDVRLDSGHPVVFVANGSHASYFVAGTRDRMWPDPND